MHDAVVYAEIMHWTADVNDPSCGVTVSIADVQYAHKLRLNQPLPAAARASLPTCAPCMMLTRHCGKRQSSHQLNAFWQT